MTRNQLDALNITGEIYYLTIICDTSSPFYIQVQAASYKKEKLSLDMNEIISGKLNVGESF